LHTWNKVTLGEKWSWEWGDSIVRALLVCGVIAGPLFIVGFLIEGALKPDYDPVRHPVSSLALGPFGWTQTANFIIAGLLTLAFAVGLIRLPGARQKIGAILVAVWGVGLLGAGAFVTDPVSGYPPGTPPLPDEATTAGALHDQFSVAAFFALAAACFVLAGGAGWRWAVYSVLSGAAFLGAFFVAGIGFAQTEPHVNVAGLWQRICVLIGWTWVTVLALRLLRESRPG
jgi:MFS family permease